jgi:catechol 2,3-dioxygenase-like lactoylglutathione lyase family enzyme
LSYLALDHVQLAMPAGEEALARRFYVGVLGFDEFPRPGERLSSSGLWLRGGPVELHLGVEADFQPARKAHPGLRVDDIDALALRCVSAGHPVAWDDRFPGRRRFYVADPFGNRIEILQLDG